MNPEVAMEWFNSLNYCQKSKFRSELSRYSSMDSGVDPIMFPDESLVMEIYERQILKSDFQGYLDLIPDEYICTDDDMAMMPE